MKFVSIAVGSKSDYGVIKSYSDTLEVFGVNYCEVEIYSSEIETRIST